MSSTGVSPDTQAATPAPGTIHMKIEVVTLPVSDVDRAKAFYESLGWRLDADFDLPGGNRVVQFTPTHSECSIAFGPRRHEFLLQEITTRLPGRVWED